MFKLIFIFFLLAQSLLYANPISDRQELMRDYNKLMRAANNLIRENEINDDLASIYEEIEEIMRVYPTLFPDDSFGGKSKASTDIIDNRELFNQIAKETGTVQRLPNFLLKKENLKMLCNSTKIFLEAVRVAILALKINKNEFTKKSFFYFFSFN